jgi:hypothetical protein
MNHDISPGMYIKALKSPDVESMFSNEEIKSLEKHLEHMGFACIDNDGKVKSNSYLESQSTSDGAVSSIPKTASLLCKEGNPVWWHTHGSTLSALSIDDRLTAGKLKSLKDNNVVCALGIEGYSCHLLNKKPPGIFKKSWGKGYFENLKKSSIIDKSLDLSNTWGMEKTTEADAHHLSCTTNDGVVICVGVDWDTGVNHFPIGAYNQVIFTGNVDVLPIKNGFDALISPVDDKLECLSLSPGKDSKVLYCR